MRAWMFSSVTSRAGPGEGVVQRAVHAPASQASIGSVSVAMPRCAASASESSTLPPARKRRRHQDAEDVRSAPSASDGDGRGERRVDAAGEAEHDAREAALARVVARAEHQRAPDFRFGVEIGRPGRLARARRDVADDHVGVEDAAARDRMPVGVERRSCGRRRRGRRCRRPG